MLYLTRVLADSPALYWPCGFEAGGTHCWDYSGNERHGEYRNSPTFGVAGPLISYPAGKAISLAATSNERVDVAYNPFTPGASLTLEAWAYRVPNATNTRLLGSNGESGRVMLTIDSAGNIVFEPNTSGGPEIKWSGAWPAENQWVHLALIVDAEASTATLCLDGQVIEAKELASTFGAAPGNYTLGNANSVPWNGRVAHAAVYPAALSAARVKAHYDAAFIVPAAPDPTVYWGALIEGTTYAPEQPDAPYSAATLAAFEANAGRKPGIVHFSDPWLEWDGFGAGSVKCHEYGAIAMKSVGASGYVGEDLIAQVLAGTQDAAIKAWAEAARDWGKPFFLRLWWEMNGTWYQWGRTHVTATQYKEAWQRFYGLVAPIAPNATFVWCPNVLYGEGTEFASMYPGDAYVDWVGLDGYNSNEPWRGAVRTFSDSMAELAEVASSKPVMLCETSSVEAGGIKADWFRDLLGYTLQKSFPRVKAYVHYNRDEEKPYDIESSEAATEAFAEGIASAYFVNPDVEALSSLSKVTPYQQGGRIAVTQEYPPDKLACRIEPPKGAPSRWASDEPLAENIADNVRLIDSMPGGDEGGSCELARNPREAWPDLAPYSNVVWYGPGGEEVGCHRLNRAPKTDGDRVSIGPELVGWKEALEDDKAVIGPGFISRDYSKWTGPSAERRQSLNGVSVPCQSDPQVVWDEENAALRLEVQGTWASPVMPCAEGWFDAGSGVRIARLIASWRNGDGNTAFILERNATDHPVGEAYEGTGDVYGATTGTIDYSPATPRRYMLLNWRYSSTPAGADGASYGVDITNLTVIGDHGLALQGTWPDVGFTASQMLGYAVSEHTVLEAREEDLEDAGYIIQNAWFSDPGPISQVVAEITKYELLDWFVFGKKRFKLKFPGTYGRKWRAHVGQSQFQEEGQDASRLWSRIVVSYNDVDGTTRTVGPPGSGADVEKAGLEITDPDHPAVRAEEAYGPKFIRQDLLVLNGISTPASATDAGERWLKEANLLSRSGSCLLTGWVMDNRGVMHPVSHIRGGDTISFVDAADTSERKVVRREYDHPSRTANLSLDAPAEGMEALLSRMNASLQSLGL